MNRLLVPAALAVLVAGCGRLGISIPQSEQVADLVPAPAAAETVFVVQEVREEVPVY